MALAGRPVPMKTERYRKLTISIMEIVMNEYLLFFFIL